MQKSTTVYPAALRKCPYGATMITVAVSVRGPAVTREASGAEQNAERTEDDREAPDREELPTGD